MIIVEIYLGISLELLWTVWGQFIFRQFLDPAYTSQDVQAPSSVIDANQSFNLFHLSLPKLFPLFILFYYFFTFFCLLVSSVSNFCTDTRGRWWSRFQAHLFSHAVGREKHCKQILLVCVGSALSLSAVLGLHPFTACVLSWSTLLRLQIALPGTV